MNENSFFKAASQDEIILYCLMGEAVCMIQELESALSCSIIIKKNSNAAKEEADLALSKHRRRFTLGKAVHLAEEEMLYPSDLQFELNNFYKERNWLIHEAMFENKEDRFSETVKNQLYNKIKSIAEDAMKIQRAIEMDLMDFCESKGRDMSKVRRAMQEHYKKSQ
jgi:hypothetical protein